jgi:hypothetical protein
MFQAGLCDKTDDLDRKGSPRASRDLHSVHDGDTGESGGFSPMHQKDCAMKDLAGPVALLALVLSSTSAFAGGPVVVEEEPVVEAASPRSGWIVPVVVGLIIICAIACGNDDDTTATTSTLG